MSFWSRLTGAKANADSAAPLEPPRLGQTVVVPGADARLELAFTLHERVEGRVGKFLSAVTSGLAKQRQREIVLTLELSDETHTLEIMRELVRFFSGVYAWAREGQCVNAGDLTKFGERALFGRPRSGLLYADSRPITRVDVPEQALVALWVNESEIELSAAFGAQRVLGRLGELYRQFPYPLFSELERASVAGKGEETSALAKIARLRAPGISFVVEDERLRVKLARAEKRELGGVLMSLPRDEAPFALMVQPDARAGAILVWHPGQREPAAITRPGVDASRTTGSFLLFTPGARVDEARMLEDGYALMLRAESWGALANALRQERACTLSLADGFRVSFEWI